MRGMMLIQHLRCYVEPVSSTGRGLGIIRARTEDGSVRKACYPLKESNEQVFVCRNLKKGNPNCEKQFFTIEAAFPNRVTGKVLGVRRLE
jgi:hypothetical protein